MKNCSMCVVALLTLTCTTSLLAGDKVEPVRLGEGVMTFDTVPGWGLGDDGKSVLGSTHGGVVVNKAGNIYCTANAGVFVFSPDGKLVNRFLGPQYTNIHDIEIRDEDGVEKMKKTM